MPRKRTTPTSEAAPATEPQELDAFERALHEFKNSSGVKLTILRYDRDEGTARYLKRVDYQPDDMSFEWIRKKWGAGTYQLRFHDADDPSRGWSQIVEIAADENADRPPASSSPGFDSNPLVSMLQQQNEILLRALVTNTGKAPSGGGGGDNTALVELIRGMNQQNTALLQGMMNRSDTSGNVLQIFEKGLEIAKDAKLESEGGWLSQVGRIAKDLLPALQEFNRYRPIAVPAQGGGPPARSPALPAGAPNAPSGPPSSGPGFTRPGAVPGAGNEAPPAPSESPPTPSVILENAMRAMAPDLLTAINQGHEAEDVADNVLDQIPPALYGELSNITAQKFLQFEKRLEPHRGYVDRLVQRLREASSDEDEGEQDGSSSSG